METMASGIWVRLHLVAALIWLTVATHEIVGYHGSHVGQIRLIVSALVGAAIIMAIGLGVQWAVNRISGMPR